ncbi:hypothetical protein EJ110_NYTH49154, partial [Nymphaea thermarum]
MAASSSSTINIDQNEIRAYRTESVPIQVTTICLTKENYLKWSVAITMGIAGRCRIAYVNGSKVEPATNRMAWDTWFLEDNQAKTWIVNSVSSDIQTLILCKKTARDVWIILKQMYGQKKRKVHVYQLMKDVYALRQRDLSVADFYAALKSKWFLIMKSIEDVYSCVEAEEQRRLVSTWGKRDHISYNERSALVSRGPGSAPKPLRHYKKTDHTVDFCWDLHPEKRGNRGRSSNGKTTVSEETKSSEGKASIFAKQIRELRAYLGRIDVNQVEASDEKKANHALAIVGDKGNSCVGEWIVDSGATYHMTGHGYRGGLGTLGGFSSLSLYLISLMCTWLPSPKVVEVPASVVRWPPYCFSATVIIACCAAAAVVDSCAAAVVSSCAAAVAVWIVTAWIVAAWVVAAWVVAVAASCCAVAFRCRRGPCYAVAFCLLPPFAPVAPSLLFLAPAIAPTRRRLSGANRCLLGVSCHRLSDCRSPPPSSLPLTASPVLSARHSLLVADCHHCSTRRLLSLLRLLHPVVACAPCSPPVLLCSARSSLLSAAPCSASPALCSPPAPCFPPPLPALRRRCSAPPVLSAAAPSVLPSVACSVWRSPQRRLCSTTAPPDQRPVTLPFSLLSFTQQPSRPGLDSVYESAKNQMLTSPSIPPIDEAYSRLSRIPISAVTVPDTSSAMFATRGRGVPFFARGRGGRGRGNAPSRPVCQFCNRIGHTVDKCWQKHGRPVFANQTVSTDSLEQPKPPHTASSSELRVDDILSQLRNLIGDRAHQVPDLSTSTVATTASASSSGMYFADPVCTATDWIIDSGVSTHLYGDKSQFTTYIHTPLGRSVILADGKYSIVVGHGEFEAIYQRRTKPIEPAHGAPVPSPNMPKVIPKHTSSADNTLCDADTGDSPEHAPGPDINELDMPIAQRKGTRSCTLHPISDFVNYLSWSAALEIGITSRGRLSYITGDKPAPLKSDPQWETWALVDSQVKVWIISSVSSNIQPLILRKPTSFDMWTVLAKMYGRKKRHLRTYQIKQSIYSLTQGDLSVAAYYVALKTKWEELDYHVTDEWKCGSDHSLHWEKEWMDHTFLFLGALWDEFEPLRSQILNGDEILGIKEVYARVELEEQRRQVMHLTTGSVPSAFVSRASGTGQRPTRCCTHCNKLGHSADFCWDLHPEKRLVRGQPPSGRRNPSLSDSSQGTPSSGVKTTKLSPDQLKELQAYIGRLSTTPEESSTSDGAQLTQALVASSDQ